MHKDGGDSFPLTHGFDYAFLPKRSPILQWQNHIDSTDVQHTQELKLFAFLQLEVSSHQFYRSTQRILALQLPFFDRFQVLLLTPRVTLGYVSPHFFIVHVEYFVSNFRAGDKVLQLAVSAIVTTSIYSAAASTTASTFFQCTDRFLSAEYFQHF